MAQSQQNKPAVVEDDEFEEFEQEGGPPSLCCNSQEDLQQEQRGEVCFDVQTGMSDWRIPRMHSSGTIPGMMTSLMTTLPGSSGNSWHSHSNSNRRSNRSLADRAFYAANISSQGQRLL